MIRAVRESKRGIWRWARGSWGGELRLLVAIAVGPTLFGAQALAITNHMLAGGLLAGGVLAALVGLAWLWG